jgi:hypothetical protein
MKRLRIEAAALCRAVAAELAGRPLCVVPVRMAQC